MASNTMDTGNKKDTCVKIVEVGPRDGLQNIQLKVPTDTKIELIERLIETGLQTIEAGAFVSPKWVPQMSDASAIFKALQKRPNTSKREDKSLILSALVPNLKGFEAAIDAGVKEVAIFTAASDTFNTKNTNVTFSQSLDKFRPIFKAASHHAIAVRGYLSCAVHCPFEGFISPKVVADCTKALIDLGCYEVSLGDTTGRGTATQVRSALQEVLQQVETHRIAGHFHDTYGQGLANVLAALDCGVRVFDSSIAGLGGCPYSPGSSGNLATEELVYLLEGGGFETNVDLTQLVKTGKWISNTLGIKYDSKAGRALSAISNLLPSY